MSLEICRHLLIGPALIVAAALQPDETPKKPTKETVRYLKPSGTDWVLESEIEVSRDKDGMAATSVTKRGRSQLTLKSKFDAAHRLIDAVVTISGGDQDQTGRAVRSEDKARVTRQDGEATDLDCPPGVIVTSAPDWTDAFFMVRRYDLSRGGRQEFAGLWIHPTQPPLRLTFAIDRLGENTVEHDGENVRLDRFAVELRGGSRYVGWGVAARLIRLVPQGAPQQGIVLDGWQKTTSELRP